MAHDLVLSGGRVIDPETGLDRVCDVGVDGRRVSAIGDALEGDATFDVSGLVVAPGFIDLHSHAQTLPGRRLQACDGVTTALELEAGRAPVDRAYRAKRSEVRRSTSASRRHGRSRACTWSRTARSTEALARSSVGWRATSGSRPRALHSSRGSSTRSRTTSRPAPSASACSSVTRRASIRPSISPSPSWPRRPACRRSRTPATSSSSRRRR